MNPALRHSAAHVFVESLADPQLRDDDNHHLRRVLRVRLGENITLCDGRGSWATALVTAAGVERISEPTLEPPPADAAVWSAIPKGDRPEWLVQKLTEIGVSRIGFVACERSVVQWAGERGARHVERLQLVARQAAMQSRRVYLPHVAGPAPLLSVAGAAGLALAEPGGAPLSDTTTGVVVGPEGGFSPAELELCAATVRLSDAILRVETAALVAGVMLTQRHLRG